MTLRPRHRWLSPAGRPREKAPIEGTVISVLPSGTDTRWGSFWAAPAPPDRTDHHRESGCDTQSGEATGASGGTTPPSIGFRAALVVATSHCNQDPERHLDRVLRDAKEMDAVLSDPAIGGFAVTTLVDRRSHELRLGIEDFLSDRKASDHVVVYLSGPAALDHRQRLFLAGTDTRLDRLASTSVEAAWLLDRLDECPAQRQILIVDTDHSAAVIDAGAAVESLPPGAIARVILMSSGADQRLVDEHGDHPSLFTRLLAQGLWTGAADGDADGFVSADDAYAYACEQLAACGSEQRPHRWRAGSQGFVLARNPKSLVDSGNSDVPNRLGAGRDERPDPLSDVARAVKVARALDRAQALAAVQGLDAADVPGVAEVLEIAHALDTDPRPVQESTERAGQPAGSRRRHIAEALVENGLITAEQLELVFDAQRDAPGPRRWIGRVVVELGLASESEVAECLARLLRLDLIDLSKIVPAPDVVRLLPRAVAERIRVLVIDRTPSGELVVATSDPTDVLAIDDVRLYTRCTDLKVLVATDSQIRDQLNRAWSLGSDSTQVAEIVQEVAEAKDESSDHWRDTSDEEGAPIVRLVTQILGDGVRMRASDIHVEVQRDTLRVRYRVDGLLRDVMEAPKRVSTSVISRIKIISGLDIAERRIPQDGRTRFTVDGTAIDARVSTLPSLHGEKVVIRLLTRGDAIPDLQSLGLQSDQLLLLEAALAVPQGLVLITGPTGSGKTNTLYSAIAKVCTPELNIVTLEDPVEVQLPGITQVGVNEKTGMTFSRGLRSILRQDPDIILVGEIRDGETAQLALKAALTGHMVLTTLHTNSAVAALTRLVDMGAEPFIVASSLTVSVAQRLVRRPCPNCVAPYEPDEVTLNLLGLAPKDLDSATPRKGTGCPECGGTGYLGRTAVYEVLNVDGPMRQVLLNAPTEAAIAAQAETAGMVTLRGAAVLKALQGKTTFEEAVRVTSR